LIPSIQVPPFKHGFGEQSLILLLQVKPSKPVPVQLQVYVFIPSIHWPSFSHAPEKQSSISSSHISPLNPGTHWHV